MTGIRFIFGLSLVVKIFWTRLAASSNEAGCQDGLDIVYLMDVSSSMNQYRGAMSDIISYIHQNTLNHKKYQASSVGLVSFSDKPYPKRDAQIQGNAGTCAHVEVPLQNLKMNHIGEGSSDLILKTISASRRDAGGDLKENVYGAIIRTMLSKNTNWSQTRDKKRKIIIAFTDAMSHTLWDYHDLKETDTVKFTQDLNLENDINYGCETLEYPFKTDVIMGLRKHKVKLYLVLLTSKDQLAQNAARNHYARVNSATLTEFYTDELMKFAYNNEVELITGQDFASLRERLTKALQQEAQNICERIEQSSVTLSAPKAVVKSLEHLTDGSIRLKSSKEAEASAEFNSKSGYRLAPPKSEDDNQCYECTNEKTSCDCKTRVVVELDLQDY